MSLWWKQQHTVLCSPRLLNHGTTAIYSTSFLVTEGHPMCWRIVSIISSWLPYLNSCSNPPQNSAPTMAARVCVATAGCPLEDMLSERLLSGTSQEENCQLWQSRQRLERDSWEPSKILLMLKHNPISQPKHVWKILLKTYCYFIAFNSVNGLLNYPISLWQHLEN